MRIAICDDNIECLFSTEGMIKRWACENDCDVQISCFTDGDSLISYCNKSQSDIIFLDIVMPLLNGIDTARELRSKNKAAIIIFLTSSVEYALDSYSVKALDYCVKPITYEKINSVLNDCVHHLKAEPQNIVLKSENGFEKVYFREIEYVEAQNKFINFYLISGRSIKIYQPLYTFEEKLLSHSEFFKCHRSYIVYIPNIDHFNMNEIKTVSGNTVPIARGYGKQFQEKYFAYYFNEQCKT